MIEKIDAKVYTGDILGKIVLDYQRLADIIGVCQPSGYVYTDELEFTFEEKQQIKIRIEKKIPEQESPDSEVTYRTFSTFEQTIKWVEAYANIGVAKLSRMNYESIFTVEDTDEWNISEFRSMLEKISTEKGRIAYVSPKKECAFVSNTAYMSCVPTEKKHNNALIFSSATARSIYDIIGKIYGQDTICVHAVDQKFCNIFTEDKKVGICVEMPEANQIHLITLGRYQAKGYKNYQLTFVKEILQNVIDAAMAAVREDKTILKFGASSTDESAIELRISSWGPCVCNDYSVLCSGCLDVSHSIEQLEIPISLKVISDILSKCDKDFVGIDIDIDDTGSKCIRIADIDLEERANAESEIKKKLGLGIDDWAPLEEQLNYRESTLVSKHYTISSK